MGGNYPDDGWTEFNFNCGDNFMGDPHECYGTARTAVRWRRIVMKLLWVMLCQFRQ